MSVIPELKNLYWPTLETHGNIFIKKQRFKNVRFFRFSDNICIVNDNVWSNLTRYSKTHRMSGICTWCKVCMHVCAVLYRAFDTLVTFCALFLQGRQLLWFPSCDPVHRLLKKGLFLTLVLLSPDMPCLYKQCRSRSVGFFRSQLIWICTVCY